MVTVAITGIGGMLGRRLASRLAGETEIDRIVGLDLRVPQGLPGAKLDLRRADILDPAFAEHLQGVDVLVHLAFQFDPIRDEALMWEVNVDGTRNVFEAAAAAGVPKAVYSSSVVVYGAHPDNDVPLTEDSPLRANPGFNYAEHKLAVEQWLWPWHEQHPELDLTVLRPAIVAGPGVDNFISRQFELPRFPQIRGHRPPAQFAHIDDVADALAHAVLNDLPNGAYNVACEGWLSFEEVTAIADLKTVEIPEEVAFQLSDRLWRMGLSQAPAGEVHYVMHPWVVSADKLIATGWRPKHTNRDALAELAAEHRDHVMVGRWRTRRSLLRNVAAAIASVLAVLLVARRVRRGAGRGDAAGDGEG